MGRVPERIRTWPGAKVSGSHFRRMAAIGAAAGWLTEDQPWNHGFGPGSPLAKLVEADGQVLLLGAPLDRLTILHHAESLVDSPQKRMARHVIPVREGGQVIWREVCDHDTSTAIGAFPYRRVIGDQDPFAVIGQLALDAGCGLGGLVGKAGSHLFPAKPLVRFGVDWMDQRIRVPDRSFRPDERGPQPSAAGLFLASRVSGGRRPSRTRWPRAPLLHVRRGHWVRGRWRRVRSSARSRSRSCSAWP